MPFWSDVSAVAYRAQTATFGRAAAEYLTARGLIAADPHSQTMAQEAYTTVVAGFKDFAGHIWDSAVNVALREGAYQANAALTNIIPSPEYVWQCYFSGVLSPSDTSWLLAYNGIHWEPRTEPMRDTATGRAWRQADILLRPRPSVAQYADWWRQGRVSDADYRSRLRLEGWHTAEVFLAENDGWVPSVAEASALRDSGVYDSAQVDYACRRAGIKDEDIRSWYSSNPKPLDLGHAIRLFYVGQMSPELLGKTFSLHGYADQYYQSILMGTQSPVWTPGEAYTLRRLGSLTDDQYVQHLRAGGYVQQADQEKWWQTHRYTPGVGDLVLWSVREVFNAPVVQRWGYDAERPVEFDYWMGVAAADWTMDTPGPNGVSHVSIPQAHWRAHWHVFPLGFAYSAYNRFRADRLARYRDKFPNIQEFTFAHLQDVIKIHDYPPATRDWLAALHAPVLPIMSVRQMYRYGLRGREWARAHLLDRGYIASDADDLLDLLAADDAIALRRAAQAEQRSIARQIIQELRTAYRMGGMDAATVRGRLAAMAWTPEQITRLLALEDARAARENLTVFIRQMRRSYLTGALSDMEVVQSMTAAQIAHPAIARYLRLWQSELGIERRALSTSQVVAAAAAGALPTTVAAVRLSRLGWTQPDAALLLQEAAAKLTRAQASAAQKAANTSSRQAKALQAAQRQAQAAERSAQSQLRRIYPVSGLKRQYCLGIRKGPTIQALLVSQGYTLDAISALLKQWTIECEESPPAPEKVAAVGTSYARRQTPISTIKQWWQNGVVTDEWARRRLAAIGVEASAIAPTISLWARTLGKKSGPSTQATPQTQPNL